MARYNFDVYGSSVYGPGTTVPFIADAISGASLPQGPLGVQCRVSTKDTIDIFWITPPETELTNVRLVRSTVGPPAWENDGDVLLDAARGQAIRWTDMGLLPATFYYYSVFVFDEQVQAWLRGGSTGAITPDSAYDMGDRMWKLVPQWYRDLDDQQQAFGDGPLKRFLALLGFEMDIERTEIESLAWIWDQSRGSAQAVPYALGQWLMEPEPELGYTNQRQLLNAATILYALKGSQECVAILSATVTGWATLVGSGTNLMVDNLDAQFDESLGNWHIGANCTFLYREGDGSVNAPNGIGMGKITATASNPSVTIYNDDPIYKGIPVTPGQVYGFQVLVRGAADPTRVSMSWWDVNGNLLSSVDGSTVVPDASDWNQVAVVKASAPALAWSASFKVSTTGTTTTHITYFSSAQFSEIASLTAAMPAYQPARDIRVTAIADKVNEVTNPKLAVDTSGWSTDMAAPAIVAGAVLTRITTDEPPPISSGTCALLVTSTANQGAVIDCGDVVAGRYYTASSWVKLVSGEGVHIAAFDVNNTVLYVSPTITTLNTWEFVAVSFVTGEGTSDVRVGIIGDAAMQARFGAVMLTQGGPDVTYFDGSIASDTSDYLWEGQADESRSHFYRQRTTRSYRFRELLPRFIVGDQTATLMFAQPFSVLAEGTYGYGPYGGGIYGGD